MKNEKGPSKDAVIYSLNEMPLKKKPHAWYYLLSEKPLVLLQKLFSQSHFHFHPVPETFFVLSGNLIIETDLSRKRVPSRSSIYVPANVIHRVRNDGPHPETQSIISIGEAWKKEDVIYVEKKGEKWVEVEAPG